MLTYLLYRYLDLEGFGDSEVKLSIFHFYDYVHFNFYECINVFWCGEHTQLSNWSRLLFVHIKPKHAPVYVSIQIQETLSFGEKCHLNMRYN